MTSKRQYAIRRIDGRLIGTVTGWDEARSAARDMTVAIMEREGADTFALIAEREDAAAIPLIANGQPDTNAMLDALEYLLGLDPQECEQQFMAEVEKRLEQRYPGESV